MSRETPIAEVVINLSLDRGFDYAIPPSLLGRVRVGARVKVPFGKKGHRTGFVVALKEKSDFPDLKRVVDVEGQREQIPPNLIRLAEWIAKYYCCSREQAVRAMLPAAVRTGKIRRKKQRFACLNPEVDLAERLPLLEKRAPKQAAVLRVLVRAGASSVSFLLAEAKAGAAVVKRLAEEELIVVEERSVDRDPFAGDVVLPTAPLKLYPEQAAALEIVRSSLTAEDARVILLHGVTGSGKTEVYLQAIQSCLENGREAIVLVPEIALTPQTTDRFRSRFGETVSVLHSGLSDGERFDEWTKIHEGRTQIVVGARSALFAPFRKLALIVVDEEHENTYKQDEAPRYQARDVAVMRGRMENATVVLGSATPSLESYYNCRVGKYVLADMPVRVDSRRLPAMEVVDMRAEAVLRGGSRVFSRRLTDLIRQRLESGDQTLLFLNRRGYATQMLCTECGYVAMCEDCSTAFTYHRGVERLCCHLCGCLLPAPQRCPQCGDTEIRYTGLGTEKVESIAQKLFPQAKIGRMDSDTMTTKHSHKHMLDAFRAGRVQILIGTQMIAKGLHFPNVTLVGVIFADLGLHLPDFRAGERTFQLLTQVAGRAGRGDVPGRVIVQTYTPYHPALEFALGHDFVGFYEEEMPMRQALGFPPVTHMAIVHFRSEEESKASGAAERFAEHLSERLPESVQVIGPMPAPIARVRRFYRYQITLRGGPTLALIRFLRQLSLQANRDEKEADVYVDIDPRGLL
ncbi:MAG: primosomal protein N' [Lentisphaerae bacterium]|jgi:primosomal protein N' (replication factor Y) (superfamily II helicase)|nr:primosomal protein N' [Lentisphaerota bacterium]MBT4820546.1 primosomal protein N' [Lentisphaerota bacterium]MBT5608700.1 primosomal protein N' [Lentisphaerota bacterium]MBT7058347.1 primosomal protein N' [Lentisphaerota bacterium]MBT7841664.1 primosomal protein N' [Lentisphaerota bacterium]